MEKRNRDGGVCLLGSFGKKKLKGGVNKVEKGSVNSNFH